MNGLKSALVTMMAFVVIASSFSFTIEKHFCLGKHVDSAVFTDTSCDPHHSKCNNCHEVDSHESNHKKNSNPGCCERDVIAIIGNDYQITIPESFTFKKVEQVKDQFNLIPLTIGQNLNQLKLGDNSKITHHLGPNLRVDRYVLFESFLL